MTPPDPMATLAKASEFAKTFVSGLGRNLPLLFSSFVTAIFLAVAPTSILSPPVSGWRGLFMALAIFLGTYFVLLWWWAKRPQRQAVWHLKHLGEDERAVLRDYLKQNNTVLNFSALYGPVCSLIGKGILTYASELFPCTDAPVAIQPYVMAYLRVHPDAIGLKTEDVGSMKLSDGRRTGLNHEAGV
jgi:hypothetical protein